MTKFSYSNAKQAILRHDNVVLTHYAIFIILVRLPALVDNFGFNYWYDKNLNENLSENQRIIKKTLFEL